MKIIYLTLMMVILLTSCSKSNKPSEKNPSESPDHSQISGKYESPLNEEGSSNATVEIKYIGNLQFEFSITTATESGCTGFAEGIAAINANGIGNWSSDDCESIAFKFADNVVNIEETNCGLHGMRCQFEGEYRK